MAATAIANGSNLVAHDDSDIIGRWRISKLIRKSKYTFIHEGIDIDNNKIVILKFLSKTDETWLAQQAKHIETEIHALQKLRHKHVIKLYAYNLDAKYRVHSSCKHDAQSLAQHTDHECKCKPIPSVVLALEHAPGGELFNLLYYTQGFSENVARTFFKQMVLGIEACHNAGIIHRDLRPKNILLGKNYSIKLSNFNTSKIIRSDSDFLMKTRFLGSRSYQSPELLRDKTLYDFKCDIFSLAVILFILLAGYPPFEEATEHDKWYKCVMEKKFSKFWKSHKQAALDEQAKDLLNGMFAYEPSERISIAEIKKHAWYNGTTLGKYTLQMAIQERYRVCELTRRQDIRIKNITAPAEPKEKRVPAPTKMVLFPANSNEFMCGGVYTFGWTNTRPIYEWISSVIASEQGSAHFNEPDNTLHCKMKASSQSDDNQIKFALSIYQSRVWLDQYKACDDAEQIEQSNEHIIYIVCIDRTDGDELIYRKIKNEFLLQNCSFIFKGLPQWARHTTPSVLLHKYDASLLIDAYWRNSGCDAYGRITAQIPCNVKEWLLRCMVVEEEDDDSDDEDVSYQSIQW